MTKRTNKDRFEVIKARFADDMDIMEFCDKQIAALSKKRTSVNSKAKAESDARKSRILSALGKMDTPVTVGEFIKLTSDEEVAGYTSQRVSALLNKLKDEGKVVKTVDKKVSRFAVA